MKLVYTHPSLVQVSQVRNALQHVGIKCSIRNEYAAGALGELAPIDTWPELWLVYERDLERATIAIAGFQAEIEEADWDCANCGNASPATFDWCWRCASERPANSYPQREA